MKRHLILTFVSIALLSCEKYNDVETPTDETPTDETIYDFTLDLSGFTRRTVELKASGSGELMATNQQTVQQAEYAINTLDYFVYDYRYGTPGELVNRKSQYRQRDGASFGTIADKLPAGEYVIELFGTAKFSYFDDVEDYGRARSRTVDDHNVPQPISDFFHKRLHVDINSTTYIDTVTLERIVGKIEVRLTDDTIPGDVGLIQVRVNSVDGYYFSDDVDETEYMQLVSVSSNRRNDQGENELEAFKRNKVFDVFVFPYSWNSFSDRGKILSNLSITAFNEENEIVAQKIIDDIEVAKNKKTILTGSLFSGGNTPTSQSFTVSVDSIYTETDSLSF